MTNIYSWSQLTPEQKKLARTIQDKWVKVSRCTERIDHTLATDAINAVYLAVGLRKVPQIIFVDSPPAAFEIAKQRDKYTGKLSPKIYRFLQIALTIRPTAYIPYDGIELQQPSIQEKDPDSSPRFFTMAHKTLFARISIQFWARKAWFLDFAYSILDCEYNPEKWSALQLLVTSCGFIWPFVDICFVSDRPTELLFKDDFIVHAENRPAVVFADGYKIYAENGVELSITQ